MEEVDIVVIRVGEVTVGEAKVVEDVVGEEEEVRIEGFRPHAIFHSGLVLFNRALIAALPISEQAPPIGRKAEASRIN